MTTIERLISAGTNITHMWDEEGEIVTTETQIQLAEGVALHYYDTDHSSSISIQETPSEIEFTMNERIAELFLRLESVSAADLFAEIGRASV